MIGTVYQQACEDTAIYPEKYKVTYPLLGLAGEVGEFCNKYKKVLRDGKEFSKEDMGAELGDILWYVSAICSDVGLNLSDVMANNVDKLLSRKQRGVLGGSGDNR